MESEKKKALKGIDNHLRRQILARKDTIEKKIILSTLKYPPQNTNLTKSVKIAKQYSHIEVF